MTNPDTFDKSIQRGPTDDGRELEGAQKHHDDDKPPLPHETDQSPASQDDAEPREVGEQAHEDLERGLEDTDRRGDPHYRDMTRTEQDRGSPPAKK